MKTFVVMRRNGWDDAKALETAAERSTKVNAEMKPDKVRWIRSYILDEGNGKVGTACIYQATDPETVREHARRADLPVDEVIPVSQTVIIHEDPKEAGVRT